MLLLRRCTIASIDSPQVPHHLLFLIDCSSPSCQECFTLPQPLKRLSSSLSCLATAASSTLKGQSQAISQVPSNAIVVIQVNRNPPPSKKQYLPPKSKMMMLTKITYFMRNFLQVPLCAALWDLNFLQNYARGVSKNHFRNYVFLSGVAGRNYVCDFSSKTHRCKSNT